MDDDQLQMLQRELMSVQEQKTNPLAERTVAEIMIKLHHEGFKFYSTTDNNEYITPQKLDEQILQLILERGHVYLGILPQILNIGLQTIETRVIKILTKNSSQSTNVQFRSSIPKIFRHNNLLLSEKYLVFVLSKIKQTLIIEGKVNLQTIAVQNQFNIKFTEKLIRQNIQTFDAQLINNQLITKQFNLMRKFQLLGYLRALNNPVSFQNILKYSKIIQDDDSLTLQRLLNEIINEKKVKGKYQNSYFIPDYFIINQKQKILQFFSSNGYIKFEMLQKQFLVSKPLQWLQKNLSESKQFAGRFIFFQQVCILTEKLNIYAQNIVQQLNHEGFIEISQLVPFDLEQKELEKFLKDYCQLKDYFLSDGYCYSEKWIDKIIEQFKEKIFKSIFLNAQQNTNKNQQKLTKKKPTKKDNKSNKLIQQDELAQKLYNQGLAEYSVAENIASTLIPILLKKFEELRKKYEKALAQNKGILNSSFLKYKSCSTIMRNIDGLQRNLNIIEKQKKKNNYLWVDNDFGPTQNDQKGIYSIIYYDNILPKGWPADLAEKLKWKSVFLKPDHQIQSELSQNCLFVQTIMTIQVFNKYFAKENGLITNPFVLSKQLEKVGNQSPFSFGFYRSQNDRRYVMVDDKLPFVGEKLLGHSGIYGIAEKAYAKFRYCYKGLMNLSFRTLLLQMTGVCPVHQIIDKNNQKESHQMISAALEKNKMVICLAQGQTGKFYQSAVESIEKRIEIYYMKPYLCIEMQAWGQNSAATVMSAKEVQQIKNNQGQKLVISQFFKIFKNVYIL